MVKSQSFIKPSLKIKIGRLELQNPVLSASGTFGYTNEFDAFMDLSKIGCILTKGITLEPRKGNPQPRIKEVNNGLINCIGLENIGIDAFINTKLPVLKKSNLPYIINIAGFSLEEYIKLGEICEDNNVPAIELNVSCPNVKSGCIEFGTSSEILYKLVSEVRNVFSQTLIVKLSSNVSNPIDLAQKVEKAGADAISAINTVKALTIDTKIIKGNISRKIIKGGLSGPTIKPIALQFIHTIKNNINIPIIGMGGISTIRDVIDFYSVGACCFQMGTANFINPSIIETILEELELFLIENNYLSLNEFIEDMNDAIKNQ